MRILNYYKHLFIASGIILILGVVSLGVFGLKLGIDFKGGTVTEIEFQQTVDQDKIRGVLDNGGSQKYQLQ
mgnify:FL=1